MQISGKRAHPRELNYVGKLCHGFWEESLVVRLKILHMFGDIHVRM